MEVEYCASCACPLEYCDVVGCARVAARLGGRRCPRARVALDDDATATTTTTTAAAATRDDDDGENDDEATRKTTSKKKSKSKAREVVVTRLSRNRKKMITNVVGLERFDVDLKEASKAFGKKFACGCSVTKGATGRDELDLQGDYSEQLAALICEKYEVGAEDVRCVDKSKF